MFQGASEQWPWVGEASLLTSLYVIIIQGPTCAGSKELTVKQTEALLLGQDQAPQSLPSLCTPPEKPPKTTAHAWQQCNHDHTLLSKAGRQ